MPYRTLCGFPPCETVTTLRVPNGLWRPDTVICDTEGNEVYVLMEADKSMRGYEAIFGDLEGRKLCCVRRKLHRAPQQDGYYICTYRPNIKGQPALMEKDCNNKSIYPFAYLEYAPLKGRYWYYLYGMDKEKDEMILEAPRLVGDNPWLGFMMVCCTPFVRCGKYTCNYRKPDARKSLIAIDQWKNMVECQPGMDVLSALCLAYIFDKSQCQPMITVIGEMDPEYDFDDDDVSLDSGASGDFKHNSGKRDADRGKEQSKPLKGGDSNDDGGPPREVYGGDEDEIDFEDPDKPPEAYKPAKKDKVPISQSLGDIV